MTMIEETIRAGAGTGNMSLNELLAAAPTLAATAAAG